MIHGDAWRLFQMSVMCRETGRKRLGTAVVELLSPEWCNWMFFTALEDCYWMFLRPQWKFLDSFTGATLIFCTSKGGNWRFLVSLNIHHIPTINVLS